MTTISARANPAVAGDLGSTDRTVVHRNGQASAQPIELGEFITFISGEVETYAGGLSGAGTTQGGATLLAANKNVATTVTGTNYAFVMPAGTSTLLRIALFNDDAAEDLELFPASGEDIGAGTNAALTIASGDWAVFEKKTASAWFLVGGTVSY